MKWELPLLLSFVLLLGIFSTFPVMDSNFTIDENGLKHYVLTPEKNISPLDVVATSLSKYNREIDFDEENSFLIFFLFVLLLVLLYRSNRVLQIQHPILKMFASDYINLFLKNKLTQTLITTNKIKLKEISEILFVLNTKLQINSNILSQNHHNVLVSVKKFSVSKKFIFVLFFSIVLIIPVYNQAYATSGDITQSLVDSYEFDSVAGSYPFIVQVDSDTYAISYSGNGADGFIQTFDIDSTGTITATGNILEFNLEGISFSSIVAVDSNTFAIAYRDLATGDGFIQTVDITGAGVITNGTAYEFDTGSGNDPHIVAVDADTFAVVFQGPGNDGWLKTLNISADGSTITQEDQFEYDNSNGRDNDIIQEGTGNKITDEIKFELNEFREVQNESLKKRFDGVLSSQELIRYVIFIVMIFTIIGAIILGFLIFRSIVSSLLKLEIIVQQFKEGKFNEKIDIVSNDELGEFSRSFDSIRSMLLKKEKLQNIGDLASRLAHDLRNPLSIIDMCIQILESQVKPGDNSKKYFKMLNSATKRMTHQLNDVMDFVRVTNLKLENVSLLEVLKSSLKKINIPDNVQIQIPQNDLKLKCDPVKLDIVFINLILNAIEAIDTGKINIQFFDKSSFVKIEIEDSGPEIPLNVMKNMFEPLFTTRSSGTGLGLTSCKNIVEQHGGQISIKTNPTIISITLSKNL